MQRRWPDACAPGATNPAIAPMSSTAVEMRTCHLTSVVIDSVLKKLQRMHAFVRADRCARGLERLRPLADGRTATRSDLRCKPRRILAGRFLAAGLRRRL
jgi:hypothetical protein